MRKTPKSAVDLFLNSRARAAVVRGERLKVKLSALIHKNENLNARIQKVKQDYDRHQKALEKIAEKKRP